MLSNKYRFCLEGVEDADVGVRIEHLVVVVLPVDQLQLEELQLLPGLPQLLLSLLQHLLQLLNQPQIFLLGRPVIEQLLQFVVLLLHHLDPLPVLINHVGELALHFLGPIDLLSHHPLDLLVLLSLQLLLPVTILCLQSLDIFVVLPDLLIDLLVELVDLIFSIC